MANASMANWQPLSPKFKILLLRHELRDMSTPVFGSELTEKGLENAKTSVLSALEREGNNIGAVLCSPFPRVLQTVLPFCEKYELPIYHDYALSEFLKNKLFLECATIGPFHKALSATTPCNPSTVETCVATGAPYNPSPPWVAYSEMRSKYRMAAPETHDPQGIVSAKDCFWRENLADATEKLFDRVCKFVLDVLRDEETIGKLVEDTARHAAQHSAKEMSNVDSGIANSTPNILVATHQGVIRMMLFVLVHLNTGINQNSSFNDFRERVIRDHDEFDERYIAMGRLIEVNMTGNKITINGLVDPKDSTHEMTLAEVLSERRLDWQ